MYSYINFSKICDTVGKTLKGLEFFTIARKRLHILEVTLKHIVGMFLKFPTLQEFKYQLSFLHNLYRCLKNEKMVC